jgi:hypothetical protein
MVSRFPQWALGPVPYGQFAPSPGGVNVIYIQVAGTRVGQSEHLHNGKSARLGTGP